MRCSTVVMRPSEPVKIEISKGPTFLRYLNSRTIAFVV